jgi:Ner family transcriptional regulator
MGRNTPEGWHREDIKAALRKKHGSLERLSSGWGYHKSTVAIALHPGSSIPTVERRIAEELGVTPHTLWPDRWTPEGNPRPVAERNLSASDGAAHRPNQKAA